MRARNAEKKPSLQILRNVDMSPLVSNVSISEDCNSEGVLSMLTQRARCKAVDVWPVPKDRFFFVQALAWAYA